MQTPEERYNEMCEKTAQFLRDNKLEEAFDSAKKACQIALDTARFAATEERPKWLYRIEKTLEIARGLERKLSTPQAAAKGTDSPRTDSADTILMSRPRERLSDISGMQDAKDEIRMSVIEPIRKPEKAKKYGLRLGGGLLLYGLPGTGKTFFAKAVAGELGLPFYVIKTDDVLCKYLGESEKIVKKIFDTARSNPMSVIYIDETNGILPSRSNDNVHEVSKRIAEIILQETDGIDSQNKNPFLLIGSTNYPDKIDDAALSRFSACIEVELPSAKTRKFILQRELGAMEINIADAALEFLIDHTNGFSGRDLVNLAAHYRKMAAKMEIAEFTLDFSREYFKDLHISSSCIASGIEAFKKRLGHPVISEKKKPLNKSVPDKSVPDVEASATDAASTSSDVTFADIKGLQEAKEIVKKALINPILYPDIYKTLKLIPGTGLLLYGPPGTGKTMFARAVANELNCKFYSVSIQDIKGKTPLQTAEKINQLFQEARQQPSNSVLFIDDCEEILSRPGNAKAYGVSQFLTELDGLKTGNSLNRVFVLIATNRPWLIDKALLRSGRISASAYIRLPEFTERREMILAALKNIKLAEDVDVDYLAEHTEGYSGAEIFHSINGGGICNLAKDYAADRWVQRIQQDLAEKDIVEPVTMDDFSRAIAQIVPCVIRERERILQNEAFQNTLANNLQISTKEFSCEVSKDHTFSLELPDVLLLKDFVFSSPTIQSVPDYKHCADNVFFYLDENDVTSNTFNACATTVNLLKVLYKIPELADEKDPQRPAILLYEGLNMAYTVIAAAYMAYSEDMVLKSPEKLKAVLSEMHSLLNRTYGDFGIQQLNALVRKFHLFPADRKKLDHIKTLASSMIAFTIAHELGHIVYGDIFKKTDTGTYNRNMERSADQFATDTLNGLENPAIREFMFLGGALGFIADISLGDATAAIAAEAQDSHPATLERFNNLLKNAPSALEKFNMTESTFLACLI